MGARIIPMRSKRDDLGQQHSHQSQDHHDAGRDDNLEPHVLPRCPPVMSKTDVLEGRGDIRPFVTVTVPIVVNHLPKDLPARYMAGIMILCRSNRQLGFFCKFLTNALHRRTPRDCGREACRIRCGMIHGRGVFRAGWTSACQDQGDWRLEHAHPRRRHRRDAPSFGNIGRNCRLNHCQQRKEPER